jgi:uncharacterized protein Yka (UPF0111/DUF47 family)
MNAVQDVAQAVSIYHITEANAESRELASMTVDACSRLTRAIAALKENERSEETVNLCVEIERIEEKSVAVMHKAIKSLFENEGDDVAALRALRLAAVLCACRKRFFALARPRPRWSKRSCSRMPET